MNAEAPRSLHDRLHDHVHLRDIAWLLAIAIVVLALAAWGLSRLAPPPPPKQIVMSTGAADGAYHAYAQKYREILAEYGMDLVLLPSKGAQENLDRLRRHADDVDVALVQSGLARASEPGLVTLGSVFYEPVWLFYRDNRVLERGFELAGKRLPIIEPHGVDLALDRLAEHRPGEPPFPQRARRESRNAGRQRGQRPGRGIGGRPHGREIAASDGGHQFGDEIGLRREVAIDCAGGDAGARGHGGNLNRRHAPLRGQCGRRRENRLLALGQMTDHVLGAPVSHGNE
jgi:hypothetical protein